ncbi:MAG: hypothetical protein HS127_04250 [Planctomycetia bacterium]|nr:hypothetical protein [Planctomycetia bacterium]
MKNEIKVLLVEDNPGDVYLVREMLDDIPPFPERFQQNPYFKRVSTNSK